MWSYPEMENLIGLVVNKILSYRQKAMLLCKIRKIGSFTKCLKKSAMWRHKNKGLSIYFLGFSFPLIPHFYDVTWLIFLDTL